MRHHVAGSHRPVLFAVLILLLTSSLLSRAQDAPQPQPAPGIQQKPPTLPTAPTPQKPAPAQTAPAQTPHGQSPAAKQDHSPIPVDAEHHFHQGIAFEREGNAENAIAEYQAAIKTYPDYFEAHYNLGRLYLDHQGYAEAITELKAAIRITPTHTIIWDSR